MGKIDTSTIEGFENMSADDKISALLGLEIPDAVDLSKYIAKSEFDKTSSKLADLKRQLNEKLTDDQKKDADTKQEMDDLKEKYEALLKESTIAKHKADLLALGYSEKLAADTAEALYNNDTAKVFANTKAFKEEVEKSIKSEQMRKTPRPDGNEGDDSDDEKPESIRIAENIGKLNAAANKKAADVLEHYKIGGHV